MKKLGMLWISLKKDDATLPCNQAGLKQKTETLAPHRLFHRIFAQNSHISNGASKCQIRWKSSRCQPFTYTGRVRPFRHELRHRRTGQTSQVGVAMKEEGPEDQDFQVRKDLGRQGQVQS